MNRIRGLLVTAMAAELDCSAYEINLMSMAERLEFVRAMSSEPAAEVVPGYEPR